MIEYKDRLIDAMKGANMTVTSLAKELGISYQAVKKVIRGDTSAFNAANNSRAAQTLNLKSHWLATGEGERNESEHEPAWTPKVEPEYLAVQTNEIANLDDVPGYSTEALALAWLLDQVSNRLDKKAAETEASAVILRYVNKIGAAPTRKPGEH